MSDNPVSLIVLERHVIKKRMELINSQPDMSYEPNLAVYLSPQYYEELIRYLTNLRLKSPHLYPSGCIPLDKLEIRGYPIYRVSWQQDHPSFRILEVD